MTPDPKRSRGKVIAIAAVIGTITLTAYLIFAGINIALNQQRRVQTGMDASALRQAVEGYFDTYNRLPEQVREEMVTEGREAQQLLLVLLAKDKDGKDLSQGKQPRFLNVEEAKHKSQGGLLRDFSDGTGMPIGLYDSWGRPFHLRFSPDDKMEIPDPLKVGEIIRGKRVIVYSYGKDGRPGGGDDIKTW